jgi:DNA-binding FadR family transcriptional regulator
VPRRNLSDQIVEDALRRIGGGEIQEGTAFTTESALCATYGVSRSVARDAVRSLAARGFLTVSQGAATVVAPRRFWNILDPLFLAVNTGEEYYIELQEAREQIEPRLAALAATRATPEAVAELVALNEELACVPDDDPERHADLDVRFHEAVAMASGNPVLVSLHHSLTSLGYRTRRASAEIPGAVERALAWHREIVDALRSGDPLVAEAAMRLHLHQVRSELTSLAEADRRPYPQAPSPDAEEA